MDPLRWHERLLIRLLRWSLQSNRKVERAVLRLECSRTMGQECLNTAADPQQIACIERLERCWRAS